MSDRCTHVAFIPVGFRSASWHRLISPPLPLSSQCLCSMSSRLSSYKYTVSHIFRNSIHSLKPLTTFALQTLHVLKPLASKSNKPPSDPASSSQRPTTKTVATQWHQPWAINRPRIPRGLSYVFTTSFLCSPPFPPVAALTHPHH